MPLHDDNETIVKERTYLVKADNNLMHNEITIVDHALTRPRTVDKRYLRECKVLWIEESWNENKHHVVIGTQNTSLAATAICRKGQPALFQADWQMTDLVVLPIPLRDKPAFRSGEHSIGAGYLTSDRSNQTVRSHGSGSPTERLLRSSTVRYRGPCYQVDQSPVHLER